MLDELVFVGGQMAEWLVTDPAAVRVRPTDDVDGYTSWEICRYNHFKVTLGTGSRTLGKAKG